MQDKHANETLRIINVETLAVKYVYECSDICVPVFIESYCIIPVRCILYASSALITIVFFNL
jgi:hypothetical protein